MSTFLNNVKAKPMIKTRCTFWTQ